jgi:hypothetical protein
MRYFLIFFCWLCAVSALPAQVGGKESFGFLRLPADARTLGVGQVNVSLQDNDLNRYTANPALLRDTLQHWASMNYMRWQASIDVFNFQYAPKLPKVGLVGFGLQIMNYGQMPLVLPNGIQQGTFKANDFSFKITKSFQQRYFTYGATLKWIGSSIAGYNAMGLGVDVGGLFQHPKQDLAIGVTFKNMGFAFNNYTNTRLRLPFDVLLGATFKPTYMPFRFSVTLQHLYRWDIVYLDPAQSTQLDSNGNPIPPEKTWGDKLLRHFVLGSEMLLSKKFHVLLGYNHLLAREMRLEDVGGLRGFSFGLRLQTSKWQFSFARGTFATRAGKNMLTLSSNLHKVFRKK